jgi:uncharacterized protein
VSKVVVDTSVFVAGLLSKNKLSNPSQMLSLWQQGLFTIVISPQILQELVATLLAKGLTGTLVEKLTETIFKIGLYIPGAYETSYLDQIDAADNKFLAAALESKADYIVSFDKKSLLPMKHFHGTTICTPTIFIRSLRGDVARYKKIQE